MPSTVRRYRTPRDSAHTSSVGRYLATVRPEHTAASWDQLIRGRDHVPGRFAAILAAAVALGDTALISRLMVPVEHALTGQPVPPFTPALRHTAQVADLGEDEAESLFLSDPTPAHLRAWVLRIADQMAIHRVLYLSVLAHLESAP
jgi:hypothetical protein